MISHDPNCNIRFPQSVVSTYCSFIRKMGAQYLLHGFEFEIPHFERFGKTTSAKNDHVDSVTMTLVPFV